MEVLREFSIAPDIFWQTLCELPYGITDKILLCGVGAVFGAAFVWLFIRRLFLRNEYISRERESSIFNASPYHSSIESIPDSFALPYSKRGFAWILLGGAMCALSGYVLVSLVAMLWVWAIVVLVIALCAWDIACYAVLDWQNLALFVLALGKGFLPFFVIAGQEFSLDIPLHIFSDVLLGAGLLAVFSTLGKMLLHKEVLGEADILFCASVSGLVGFYNMILCIFWGCILASLVVICAKILVRHTKTPTMIPLIPYIVGGLALGLLIGVLQ